MIPIEGVLDKYEVDYNPDRDGNQQVKCPFHPDSHASASVNLSEGLFNCFGCEIKGDAITLLMVNEKVEFSEAKRVAQELANGASSSVSRRAHAGGGFLPRSKGHRPGGRKWVSPWGRKRP